MNKYEKLLYVQINLRAPKEHYNKFGNFSYRNCDDIFSALKPLLKEVNALLYLTDNLVFHDNRIYIQALAEFIDCDTGESIKNTGLAREEENKKGMDACQITGTASSYARKYALNGLFCIDDARDADEPIVFVTKGHIEKLQQELNRTGVGKNSLLGNYGCEDISSLTIVQYEDAIKRLRGKPDKEKVMQEEAKKTAEEIEQMDEEDLPFK